MLFGKTFPMDVGMVEDYRTTKAMQLLKAWTTDGREKSQIARGAKSPWLD